MVILVVVVVGGVAVVVVPGVAVLVVVIVLFCSLSNLAFVNLMIWLSCFWLLLAMVWSMLLLLLLL